MHIVLCSAAFPWAQQGSRPLKEQSAPCFHPQAPTVRLLQCLKLPTSNRTSFQWDLFRKIFFIFSFTFSRNTTAKGRFSPDQQWMNTGWQRREWRLRVFTVFSNVFLPVFLLLLASVRLDTYTLSLSLFFLSSLRASQISQQLLTL